MRGYVYDRCKCAVVRDGAGRRVTCPKPHGSWCWVADVPVTDSQPGRQQTRAGYQTKREAEQGLREHLALADRGQVVPPVQTTLGSTRHHQERTRVNSQHAARALKRRRCHGYCGDIPPVEFGNN